MDILKKVCIHPQSSLRNEVLFLSSLRSEAPPSCHPEQARRVKAPWQAARFACRLARCACRSSFPKISRRCDFREPCFKPARTEGSLKTKMILVIPSVSRGILYRTQKPFRTRHLPCLPLGGKVSFVTNDGRGEWGNAKASARCGDTTFGSPKTIKKRQNDGFASFPYSFQKTFAPPSAGALWAARRLHFQKPHLFSKNQLSVGCLR